MSRIEPLPAPVQRLEPLRWIGAYKILKAALAVVGAVLVMWLRHRDLPSDVLRWMERFDIDSSGRFGQYILQKVIALHVRRLEVFAAVLLIYSVITTFEGIGLMRRRRWAEWLTTLTTCAFVPFEIRHCLKRFTWVRLAIIVVNIGVVIYLVWRIKVDQHRIKKPDVGVNAESGGGGG